ncbi:MAG TPA: polysaccharide deacetylase family protein [Vicinamibacterales bacterium]|nr:polysaccharide deacetylase family protein [Vicinamibacterales bacterium]
MKFYRLSAALPFAVLVLTATAIRDTRAIERTVAVTFDDLPATSAGAVATDTATLEDLTRRLLTAIRQHNVPAIGFVNESGLRAGPTADDMERRIGLLRMWLDAGLELGNHTYSHRDLNTIPLDQFQADVLRGETVTRALLKERGRTPRFFRHPFLHVGADLETRRAFEAFLAGHGYAVAPVTIDNDEFVYAAEYAGALRRGDRAAAARIADDYLRYIDEVFSFFEEVSRRTIGHEIAQVILLHANSLNADRFSAVADAIVRRGYRFVTLAKALEDPAYRQPDNFVGAPSNSWFSHWEVTAGRKSIPTPAVPAWLSSR